MQTGELYQLESLVGEGLFQQIKNFISTVAHGEQPVGEWVELSAVAGAKAIALNQSKYKENVKEYHQQYSDVHITIAGEDIIHIGTDVTSTVEAYNSQGDYGIVEAESVVVQSIRPGFFMYIQPNEYHSNELVNEQSLKTVIKLISAV